MEGEVGEAEAEDEAILRGGDKQGIREEGKCGSLQTEAT